MPTVYEGEDIIRGVRVMPHMAQLQYTTGLFAVVETLFAPRHDAGLAIFWILKRRPRCAFSCASSRS